MILLYSKKAFCQLFPVLSEGLKNSAMLARSSNLIFLSICQLHVSDLTFWLNWWFKKHKVPEFFDLTKIIALPKMW